MGVLSSASTYAIRAALFVASTEVPAGSYVSTRRIADELDVPYAFLGKVLQELTHGGLLISSRGPTGGVALARPAAEISLLDIVRSADNDAIFHDCVLGLPRCSDVSPCPLHDAWREERSRLEHLFATTTLSTLAAEMRAANRVTPHRGPKGPPRALKRGRPPRAR